MNYHLMLGKQPIYLLLQVVLNTIETPLVDNLAGTSEDEAGKTFRDNQKWVTPLGRSLNISPGQVYAITPPSIRIVSPVINELSSDARKATNLPTSSGKIFVRTRLHQVLLKHRL
jgi:hypothetical protein